MWFSRHSASRPSLQQVDETTRLLGGGLSERFRSQWRQRRGCCWGLKRFLLTLFFAFCLSPLLYLALSWSSISFSQRDFNPQWARYSPYFPQGEYVQPPPTCQVTQVHILQRHGARFPTKKETHRMKPALKSLQSVGTFIDRTFLFLNHYKYDLAEESLLPFGVVEASDAGKLTFARYGKLVNARNLPFVRASGAGRVIESAKSWTEGFSLASHNKLSPSISVILPELPSSNNTLNDKLCPNAGDPDEKTSWESIYTKPIIDRLQKAIHGVNLTALDVTGLMMICPFETLARQKESVICRIFERADFEAFEYYWDLGIFYGRGYGNPLGRVQGVGYVNELIARLTHTSVQDETQTNRTLDSSPLTFPLDRSIYADFSHDNVMIAIYTALGLFKQPHPLDPKNPDTKRTWRFSSMVPFSGRLVTEKLECSGKEYVRMLVDDAVQDLEFCGGVNGMCKLDRFVKSQRYSRNNGEGDFQKCSR